MTVTGTVIRVGLATDDAGAATSTAAQVVAALTDRIFATVRP